MRILTALAAAIALAGCATPLMTEEECLAGAWFEAGREDGAEGRLNAAFDRRAALCSEFDVGADIDAYKIGREAGLAQLCTEPGGYNLGRDGGIYRGVCSTETELDLLAGYLVGRRLHEAGQALARARAEYDNAASNLDTEYADIDRARRILADKDAKEKRKKWARSVLKNADNSIYYARRRLDEASYSLGRADEIYASVAASSDSWAESDEFYDSYESLFEAHNFSRSVDAIDHCADEEAFGRPVCIVRAGAILTAGESGVLCAAGPGEARLERRAPVYDGSDFVGFRHAYEFYAVNERGRTARRSSGFFDAVFDAEGAFQALICAPEGL
ncbi:MAG: DUF2799 domain-containing protein [Pseudomonadota bacterium]